MQQQCSLTLLLTTIEIASPFPCCPVNCELRKPWLIQKKNSWFFLPNEVRNGDPSKLIIENPLQH